MTDLKVTNANYCATFKFIETLVPLEGMDNVQGAMIFGNHVIVSKDVKPGDIGIYFPLECALSSEFLSNNNLYRDKTLNVDQTKKGYFEAHGRIRAVKFASKFRSEGFFCPVSFLDYLYKDSGKLTGYLSSADVTINADFNEIDGHEICRKYIPKGQRSLTGAREKGKNKESIKVSRLVDGQFRLHYETPQLKKNLDMIHPEDMITISEKWHGTSWVVGKILTIRSLSWIERVLSKFGVKVVTEQYDTIYSSRKVIKNCYLNANPNHFYGHDLWQDISERVKDLIPNGFTLYGEAVGYLPSGAMIQKGYHYGAKDKTMDLYVYRVTFTNNEGKVFELDWEAMKEFCFQRGLNTVKELYRGLAKDLFPRAVDIEFESLTDWRDRFLEQLIEHKAFGMGDVMCKANNYEVPAEGIVIRKDGLNESKALKLKNFRFLSYESSELDKGEIDLETSESLSDGQVSE